MIERALILFTKPACPGRVKTRLIGELSPEQAAQLHQAFLDDVLASLRAGPFEFRLAWALDEGEELPQAPAPSERQVGADLGERLWNALRQAARGSTVVAAVGSDHPELTSARVNRAFEIVEGSGDRTAVNAADVALGPAADGGYYLIAVRSAVLRAEIFAGVDWSTPRVLGQTLANCARLGLRVELLPEEHDVDTPDDLRRLIGRLAGLAVHADTEGEPCPRTRALLAAWGRLSVERLPLVEV